MKDYFLILFLIVVYSHSQARMLDDLTLEILAIEVPVIEFPGETTGASVALVWAPMLTAQGLPESSTLMDQGQANFQEPTDSWREEENQMEKFCSQASQNPALYETSLVESWQQ